MIETVHQLLFEEFQDENILNRLTLSSLNLAMQEGRLVKLRLSLERALDVEELKDIKNLLYEMEDSCQRMLENLEEMDKSPRINLSESTLKDVCEMLLVARDATHNILTHGEETGPKSEEAEETGSKRACGCGAGLHSSEETGSKRARGWGAGLHSSSSAYASTSPAYAPTSPAYSPTSPVELDGEN